MVNSVSLYGSQGVSMNSLYDKKDYGVSIDDLYGKNVVSASGLYGNQDFLGLSSIGNIDGIMPMNKKTVTIDGETYEVTKVQDKKPGVMTYAPTYKEVVVIDGKQYDVKTVRDNIACDKTKQVVVVDGEQYDVKDGNKLNLLF